MLLFLSQISTWLFVEILATSILMFLNFLIPILLFFASYRTLINFYFSSIALSSSLINSLYLFYLIQIIRIKTLSENNCRAIYYLQTAAILVLGYTIVAMHAYFILNLFPSSTKSTNHSLYQSCRLCLRRLFRRFCFCSVLFLWAFSFTSVIPLLYTIDSNEKMLRPVFCPGIKELHYLDEWFDIHRPIQTVLFHLLPFLLNLLFFLIASGKLIFECLTYIFNKVRASKYFSCRMNSSSINLPMESFHKCFLKFFFRFIFIFSTCLLACIYPIVMRFYVIYFSAFIPLIFVTINYALGDFPHSTQQTTIIENENLAVIRKVTFNNEISIANPEQIELQPPPSIANLLTEQNQRKSFTNYLYENTRTNLNLK